MGNLLGGLVSVYLLTVFIEALVFSLAMGGQPVLSFIYSLLINGVTNPLANYAWVFESWNPFIIEMLVIIVEMILICALLRAKPGTSLLISICANLSSFGIGSGLFYLLNTH